MEIENKENVYSGSEDEDAGACALMVEHASPRETGDGQPKEQNDEGNEEKGLDHDQDRRNPQYIPKGGAFYEHDNRTLVEINNELRSEGEKRKKTPEIVHKKDQRWLHDLYDENEQVPKSAQELITSYGYDIRQEDRAPRARRNKRYSRGQERYERSWQDEDAYQNRNGVPFSNQLNKRPNDESGSRRGRGRGRFNRNDSNDSKYVTQQSNGQGHTHSRQCSHGHHTNYPGFHSGWGDKDREALEALRANPLQLSIKTDGVLNDLSKSMGEVNINRQSSDGNEENGLLRGRGNPHRYSNIRISGKDKDQRKIDIQTVFNDMLIKNEEDDPTLCPLPKPEDMYLFPKEEINDPRHSSETVVQGALTFENLLLQKTSRTYSLPRAEDLGQPEVKKEEFIINEDKESISSAMGGIKPDNNNGLPFSVMFSDSLKVEQSGIVAGNNIQLSADVNPQPPAPINLPSPGLNYPAQYSGNDLYLASAPAAAVAPVIEPNVPNMQPVAGQEIPIQELPMQELADMNGAGGYDGAIQPDFVQDPLYYQYPPNIPYTPIQSPGGEMYQSSSGITYYSPETQSAGPPPPRRPNAAIPIVSPPE